MGSLSELLSYKRELEIINPDTQKPVKKVWIRVLGDLDLTRAYKVARLASAAKRAALRDESTEDYQDEVLGVVDLTKEEQIDLIKTARLSNIVTEATVAVIRPDLPKLEEVAVDPDAATLEELEKLDKEEQAVEKTYREKLDEYIEDRTSVLDAELKGLDDDELLALAKIEVSNVVPFALFVTEVNAQKAYLGTYSDKDCKIREFESVEEFKQLPKFVQDTISIAINELEIDGPTIKN